MDFSAASKYMINRLQKELNPSLTYHCVEHTLDVLQAIRRLADAEQVSEHDRILLETASLYHDSGMLVQYKDHESASAAIAEQTLPGFGYSEPVIHEITRLIMVTQLPQRPYSPLEQMICDADLDYLGRDDFFIHSFKLKLEWQTNGIRHTTLAQWFEIQIKFLSEHKYFTNSAILLRNETKQQHLEDIRKMVYQHSNPKS
ncbi:MAG: HD domain-containing protein [Bacteroidales bacterium]